MVTYLALWGAILGLWAWIGYQAITSWTDRRRHARQRTWLDLDGRQRLHAHRHDQDQGAHP